MQRRGDEWAFARLVVDGDRIVDADADGLARPLAGLTLLEAAAVPGETLAVDALANAIGPVFRAARTPGRVAVAMSGGVDSAVALLRAGPDAIGVTLRLWIDPAGARRPSARAARRRPSSRRARPATRSALPHVTLDLREEFRRAVVAAVRGRLRARARRRTRACAATGLPVRRAARVRAAGRRRAPLRRATTRGSSSTRPAPARRAAPTRRRTSRTCSRASIRRCLDRVWFPLGDADEGRDARRGRSAPASPRRAGPRARRRASSRGGDYRDFLERHGARVDAGRRSSTRRGRCSGVTRASGGSRPGQRRGVGVAVARAALRAALGPPTTNTVVVGPRARSGARASRAAAASTLAVERVEAKLRYRSPAGRARP